MCHWTVTTLMFIFHAFYRKLLLTLQGITRASVYYQAFLSSSRTWHWWGQGLGQTFGLNMCLCLSTLHSSMDFTEPDSWLGELNPYWLRQCLLIVIMGRGKSHLKELLWMPQNWTKTCVGSDEAAWVFFFFLYKDMSVHPRPWQETWGSADELGDAQPLSPGPGWPWASYPACVITSPPPLLWVCTGRGTIQQWYLLLWLPGMWKE